MVGCFDSWEMDKIFDIEQIDPYYAKEKFKEYLTKYPNDYLGYQYYAFLLMTLRETKEAKEVMEYGLCKFKFDPKYHEDKYRVLLFYRAYYTNKAKLLLYNGDYEKLEKVMPYFNLYREEEGRTIDFYYNVKSGKTITNREYKISYLFRQIIEYKEEDFLEHIEKHQMKYNKEEGYAVFKEDFPLFEVIEEFKKNRESYDYLYPGLYTDDYYFKYDDCGINRNNKNTNYFKIICFHNTSDIITMCPVEEYNRKNIIDLNYLNKKETKVRKLTQVEKFNLKYKD